MPDTSLLPPSATGLMRRIEGANNRATALPVPLRKLWSVDDCPSALLPWLAWALAVDRWDSDWSDGKKRDVIRAAIPVHRAKGTLDAARAALAAFGYGDAEVIEFFGRTPRDGTYRRDRSRTYAAQDYWSNYRVVLKRPMTLDQAAEVRALLRVVTPRRCRLVNLDFREAVGRYNGTIPRNGTFTRGLING